MSEKAASTSAKTEVEEGASASSSESATEQQATTAEKKDEAKGSKDESLQSKVDKLQEDLARMLHLGGMRGKKEEKEEIPKLLEEVSFQGVARYIRSGKCKNIVTMVGAGISTSAGIPDFRSPGSGLYDNLQQYNLPSPQAIFMIDFFKENPKPFFVLAKELFPGSLKPTPCHYFIKLLHEKGILLRHFTQNIDTLERVAGLPQDALVEAHGTFHTGHCLECGAAYDMAWMKERIFADEIPTCTKDCPGVVKPDIVFFGENLPLRFALCTQQDLVKCDLLIVMGTSLVVQPFASLVNRVPPSTPRLYINLEKTSSGGDDFMALLMGGRGFQFDDEDNYRDVFQQDTCDDGCLALADLLGWGDELRKLVKTEHARIDKKTAAKERKPQKGEASK